MPTVQLLTYPTDQGLTAKDRESIIGKTRSSITDSSKVQHFLVGTQVPDEHVIQVVAELEGSGAPAAGRNALIQSLHDSLGGPQVSMTAEVSPSPFAAGAAATSNVVEYVQVWFASSRLTPEFRASIEDDFARFNAIFTKESDGDEELTSGWSMDDEDHPEVKAEKARCFFVMRGWASMERFVKSTQTDAAKEAFPIVFGWQAPFKLVRLRAHCGFALDTC